MKKFIFLFLLINFQLTAYSQVIKGFVRDKNTDKAINYALAYFNGTSVGTQSNQNGYF